MATTCTNCGCAPKKCGCQDTMLTTPTAYPTPVGCPNPIPCSEAFDAQCVVYTGEDITCNDDVVVSQDMTVAEAIQAMTDYFCNTSDIITANILCGQDIVVPADTTLPEAIELVVDYFCSGANDTGWVDLEGFAFYQGAMANQRPQVRRIGKQVHFRGNLYVPLTDGSTVINLTAPTTYDSVNRKTPFLGAGGVIVDSNKNMYFNSTGSAASTVIPTSVLDAGTMLDGNYKLTREVASRRIVVESSGQPTGEEGYLLLHSYVEVTIESLKYLKLRTLASLEYDGVLPVDYTGSSTLRKITSSFATRANVINFSDYLFGQSGINSTGQSIITSGSLIIGFAYFIKTYGAGDDFSNVGAVNSAGTTFIATGSIPTTWTNGTELIATPLATQSFGLFYKDPALPTEETVFPMFLDGSYLDAAEPTDIGGFYISLDGLTAFVQ